MVKHHDKLEVSEGEVLRQINNLKEYVNKHSEDIPSKIYKAMTGVSQTFLAFQKSKGTPGWAKQVLDEAGSPMWDAASSEIIESSVPLLFIQGGGAMFPGDIKYGAESSLVTKADGQGLSVDQMYDNARSYIRAIDERNKEIAGLIGPVAMINKVTGGEFTLGPFPPFLPIGIPFPTKLIVLLINIFLETCRLLVTSSVLDIPYLRKILSIILAFFDVIQGNWKDGILTFIGYFNETWMFYGIIGKLMLWMYNLISPDLQIRLEEDIFASGKSMVIGFWLWLASIVAPLFVRNMINEMINAAVTPLRTLNEQIAKVEKKAQAAAAPIGAKVTFPRVPLDKTPSFDDIQNFQSIVHRPEVYCSPEFQQAIAPAMTVAPLRLVLEMMNIPITPDRVAKACAGQPTSTAEAITQALTPSVVIIPPQTPPGMPPGMPPGVPPGMPPMMPPIMPYPPQMPQIPMPYPPPMPIPEVSQMPGLPQMPPVPLSPTKTQVGGKKLTRRNKKKSAKRKSKKSTS